MCIKLMSVKISKNFQFFQIPKKNHFLTITALKIHCNVQIHRSQKKSPHSNIHNSLNKTFSSHSFHPQMTLSSRYLMMIYIFCNHTKIYRCTCFALIHTHTQTCTLEWQKVCMMILELSIQLN